MTVPYECSKTSEHCIQYIESSDWTTFE